MLIDQYLDYKKWAWSERTKKNNRHFLKLYGEVALNEDPHTFLDKMNHLSPYSRKTIYIVCTGFWGWVNKGKVNIYDEYRKQNKRAFKGVYKKKEVKVSYEWVKETLLAQEESDEKSEALRLLGSAQRFNDGRNSTSSSFITGKGNKERINLSDSGAKSTYFRLYRYLRRLCGISPHILRKLALSHAAENGASAADLCEIAGWASIAPAYFYLQPRDRERLARLLR